ncbi:MAG: hypothetical protein VX681_02475, partial [Myxococcota bacterium]|nr:hypothetical protein [Myxococcota bacterium]
MSLLTCLLASLCGLLPLAEDEGEILDQFEAALRLAAHRGELPATLDPTFKTLEGLDSAAVVDALADAYAAIEERAETTEAKRQKRLEVGARDRKEIDDLRRAQDRILKRMKLLKSGKARRRAYERALAEERGSWSLRMALAALCGPTKVELAPLRAALESSGQDLFIALEIARRLGKRAGPLIEPVVAALHRQQP